jgi:CheY-like chemotaxis protein
MSQPATVLVVDDDADVTDTMREILEDEGHRVFVAGDGIRALEVVHAERPDLVLLDLEMPKMDGRHFLAEMRKTPELDRVQVVVLSGSRDAGDLGTEAVPKPLRLDTLLGLINRVGNATE